MVEELSTSFYYFTVFDASKEKARHQREGLFLAVDYSLLCTKFTFGNLVASFPFINIFYFSVSVNCNNDKRK